MTVAGRCDWLVGGTPSEVPERYAPLSAPRAVHPGCPPTLLVHGRHDEMAPWPRFACCMSGSDRRACP